MNRNKKLIGIITIGILLLSSIQILSVYAAPVTYADFTYSPENPQFMDVIQFTDLSSYVIVWPGSDNISYWWDFGDGYFSNLQNPVHCYYMNGSFDVTLTIDNEHNHASVTKTIHVGQVLLPDIKLTITADANVINPGDPVNYTYEVINEGNCPLKNVTVIDDKLSTVAYVSGDDNDDGWLDIDEIWIYFAFAFLYEDTVNIANVTAEDELGRMVYDEDDEFVDVVDEPPAPEEVFVDDDFDSNTTGWNYDHFAKIQDAIDAVTDYGGQIYAYSGIYYENLFIDKSITLIGENRYSTVIMGSGDGDVVTLAADRIEIMKLSIQNSGDSYSWDAGVEIMSNNSILYNLVISDNCIGIRIDGRCCNHIVGCDISSNRGGIKLRNSHANEIVNCLFDNNEIYGIDLESDSSGNMLVGNSISNSSYGISVENSHDVEISGCITNSKLCGLRIDHSNNIAVTDNTFIDDGVFIFDSFENFMDGNTVNGKPLVYLENQIGNIIEDAGQVILVNCIDITIQNITFSNHGFVDVELLNSNNCKIYNNIFSSNNSYCGLLLFESHFNNVTNNIFSNLEFNSRGIEMLHSSNNILSENTISSFGGINIEGNSTDNIIKENEITKNNYGIVLSGFYNEVYHNNFIDNIVHVLDIGDNIWDNGYPSGGNYWDDYNGTDSNDDGIGDTPYEFENGTDNYPLIEPYGYDISNPNIEVEKSVESYAGMGWHSDEGLTLDGVGDDVTFKIDITNTGDVPLDLRVEDFLPVGLIYANNAEVDGVPHEPDDILTPLNGHVIYIWNIGDVAPGQTVRVSFRAITGEPGMHINRAHVTGFYDQLSVFDNDTAFVDVDVPIEPEPDILVKKYVKEGCCGAYLDEGITVDAAGDYMTFKLVVTNTGNIPFEHMKVIDFLPQGLTYDNHAIVNGIPHEPDVIDFESYNWLFDEINPGETITITFRAVASTSGNFTNHAVAEGVLPFYQQLPTIIYSRDYAYVNVGISQEDTVPPVTECQLDGDVGTNNWFTSPVAVSLSATDDNSGVSQIFYCVEETDANGNSADAYGPEIAVDGDEVVFNLSNGGYYTIYYHAVDNAGNVESLKSTFLKIDVTPPVTKCQLSGDTYNGWFTTPVAVSLSATDSRSDIMKIGYYVEKTDENGNLISIILSDSVPGPGGPVTFTIDDYGYYKIYYYSKDFAGNQETPKSKSIKIDRELPDSQCLLEGVLGDNGFYTSPVIVSLSAIDNLSGVSHILYCVEETDANGNSADAYGPEISIQGDSTSFIIDTSGYYKIYYYAVDNAGNQELINSKSIKIDTTPPVTGAILPPCPGKYYTDDVTVTLQARDVISGVAFTYYRINGELVYSAYDGPFTVSGNGVYIVEFCSVDNAGNIEEINSVFFRIQSPFVPRPALR